MYRARTDCTRGIFQGEVNNCPHLREVWRGLFGRTRPAARRLGILRAGIIFAASNKFSLAFLKFYGRINFNSNLEGKIVALIEILAANEWYSC